MSQILLKHHVSHKKAKQNKNKMFSGCKKKGLDSGAFPDSVGLQETNTFLKALLLHFLKRKPFKL